MSRSRVLQQTLFRQHVKRLEPMLALASQPIEHSRAVRRHVMGFKYKSLGRWRKSAFEGDAERLADLFPITGLERFELAQSIGRGVILVNSHFGGARYVPQVLAHMG